MLQQAMIINAIVLVAVLEADLGSHRKVTRFRVLRPLILAIAIAPFFVKGVQTNGSGLTLEVALAAAGIVLGLVAVSLMTVYRSQRTGKPVTRAGFGYATLWIVAIGARAAFSYGSVHWFGPQLGSWMTQHSVDSAEITDALIFMAVAMLVTRTIGIVARARNLAAVQGSRAQSTLSGG